VQVRRLPRVRDRVAVVEGDDAPGAGVAGLVEFPDVAGATPRGLNCRSARPLTRVAGGVVLPRKAPVVASYSSISPDGVTPCFVEPLWSEAT
jgi:hypothetical protein